jgi:hypothetical protein
MAQLVAELPKKVSQSYVIATFLPRTTGPADQLLNLLRNSIEIIFPRTGKIT